MEKGGRRSVTWWIDVYKEGESEVEETGKENVLGGEIARWTDREMQVEEQLIGGKGGRGSGIRDKERELC